MGAPDAALAARVASASRAHPKPPAFTPAYGTAGFRATADLLLSTLFRCGLLMAARSGALGGAPVGVCVTASHNPPADNGVKLVDPSGHMLAAEWEVRRDGWRRGGERRGGVVFGRAFAPIARPCFFLPSPQPLADRLANAPDDAAVAAAVAFLLDGAPSPPGTVWIGHDTRPSSPALAAAVAAGVAAVGGTPHPVGLTTTPQLHWLVAATAAGGDATLAAYTRTLAGGHAALVAGCPPVTPPSTPLIVDAANGVGGAAVAALAAATAAAGFGIVVRNADTADAAALNCGCGSDAVQKSRRAPAGFADVPAGTLCASLDGDADRVVYFVPTGKEDGSVTLFDGDRIAALLARWAAHLVSTLPPADPPLTVGAVRTAYANGAAVEAALAALGGEAAVPLARTGVKFVHATATAFDVGVYFEANGHGAVLFSDRFKQAAASAAGTPAGDAAAAALAASNQAVGDALSALLLVDAALCTLSLTPPAWGALYTDLPSRQTVVWVADRTVVAMNAVESAAVAPAALVAAVDAAVSRAGARARAFARPSGTEDVVRVFAEAETQAQADALAVEVAQAVFETCGGVGERPVSV